MVLRSKSGLPVIMPAGSDSSLIKGVYASAVFAGERDVDGSARCTLPDPEIRLSRLSEAHTGKAALNVLVADEPTVDGPEDLTDKTTAQTGLYAQLRQDGRIFSKPPRAVTPAYPRPVPAS